MRENQRSPQSQVQPFPGGIQTPPANHPGIYRPAGLRGQSGVTALWGAAGALLPSLSSPTCPHLLPLVPSALVPEPASGPSAVTARGLCLSLKSGYEVQATGGPGRV